MLESRHNAASNINGSKAGAYHGVWFHHGCADLGTLTSDRCLDASKFAAVFPDPDQHCQL